MPQDLIEEPEDRDTGPIQQAGTANPMDLVDPYVVQNYPSHKIGLSPPPNFSLAPGEVYVEAPITQLSQYEFPRMWVGTRKRLTSDGVADQVGAMVVMIDNKTTAEALSSLTFANVIDDGHQNLTIMGTFWPVAPAVPVEVAIYDLSSPNNGLPNWGDQPFIQWVPYTAADIITNPGTWAITLACPVSGPVQLAARQRHQPTVLALWGLSVLAPT